MSESTTNGNPEAAQSDQADQADQADRAPEAAKASETGTAFEAETGGASRLESARARLREVAGDIQQRYQKISRNVGQGVGTSAELKDRAARAGAVTRERVDTAGRRLREGYGQALERTEGVHRDLTEYVNRNPGKAVIFAAGAGFVLGLLLRGRRK